MNDLNLSAGERLIVVMLCDLYKALNLKCPIDPALLASPTCGAEELARSQENKGNIAAEVSEILEMWSAIERGYKHLTVEEKREVEAGAGPLGRGVRFSGFCEDTEGRYCAAAHVLIEGTEQFERFQGRNVIAHMPSLDGYRRMLRLFASMRPAMIGGRLGVRQIIDLANAEKYPG